jgi:hypothetical protein
MLLGKELANIPARAEKYWRLPVPIHCIRVGTRLQEQSTHPDVALEGCQVEARYQLFVTLVDASVRLKHHAREIHAASCHGGTQSSRVTWPFAHSLWTVLQETLNTCERPLDLCDIIGIRIIVEQWLAQSVELLPWAHRPDARRLKATS